MTITSNPVLIDYAMPTQTQKAKEAICSFPRQLKAYLLSLFPIIQWVHRYNFSWLLQDAIAGITVGMLIVPQGIAYAKIANLDPQYGLYTSFVGVTLYCFFGTSKDISIGPITVVSLLVGQAVSKVTQAHPDITGPEVAVCLSLFAGIVTVLIGLIRLGILVDFISEPSIAGYMTGSAITISLGQWPKVFGLQGVNTHKPPYLIIYSFFKHLPHARLDAAFGLTALAVLYIIKLGSTRLSQRLPKLKKPLFFLNIMRSGLIVILGTAISYLVNVKHHRPVISIIQDVPAGFDAMAVPTLNMTILREASGVLPSIVIILILEHVSVAKSFGRMSNYSINPNQEILAIGMSNIIGAFFGAYPATGAFSRTAVMARSGAKTPMAGVFSGAVVVLALYALTPAFYYIPESVLGAVVIHAVVDLISGPTFLKTLWHQSKLEFLIFVIAVTITIFVDVETAIYVSVSLSLFLMLLRLARPSVSSLGRVKLMRSAAPHSSNTTPSSLSQQHRQQKHAATDAYGTDSSAHYIFVDDKDPHFSHMLDPLPAGIVAVKLSNSMLYPNANYIVEQITAIVQSRTRPGNRANEGMAKEEATWNQPDPSSSQKDMMKMHQCHAVKPYLDAIVLDFSCVDRLDATALHTVHALQHALDQYAGGKAVEWHFCQIANPHVRQMLIDSGFGYLTEREASLLADMKITKGEETTCSSADSTSTPATTLNSLRQCCDSSDSLTLNAVPNLVTILPRDNYPAFHWNMEAAIYAISQRAAAASVATTSTVERRNLSSSITVTIY